MIHKKLFESLLKIRATRGFSYINYRASAFCGAPNGRGVIVGVHGFVASDLAQIWHKPARTESENCGFPRVFADTFFVPKIGDFRHL